MQGLPRPLRFLFAAAVLAARCAGAADGALGPFDAQADIGAPRLAGGAAFDGRRFVIQAGGANMMGAHDEFHFVWRKLTGDFAVSARIAFAGPGAQAHRKAGLMARAALDTGAAYVDATIHGNGPKALQVRRSAGGPTEMLVASAPGMPAAQAARLAPSAAEQALPAGAAPAPRTVTLERRGKRFTVTIREAGQPDVRRALDDVDLPDTLYVGMFVCAHDAGVLETALFDQVAFAPAD